MTPRPAWAMTDEELETRIRASLRRHADEVDTRPPAWHDLVERSGAVVVPLRAGISAEAPSPLRPGPAGRRPPRQWVRPALAAAATLAVVLTATMLVERGEDGDGTPADGEPTTRDAPDGPVIPSPGSLDFDRAGVPALPDGPRAEVLVTGDPVEVARDYLVGRGLDTDGRELRLDEEAGYEMAPIGDGRLVEIALVWWTVRDEPDIGARPVAQGQVLLRDPDLDPVSRRWEIVGAFTSTDAGITGVRRAEGVLSFGLYDYLDKPTVQVRAGGVPVFEGRLQNDGSTQNVVVDDPAPGKVITIEVQHLVDGQPVSITAMALAPPTTSEPPETGRR